MIINKDRLYILTAQQIKKADQKAVEQGVSTTNLMERAGKVAFHEIRKKYPHLNRVAIFAGPGNNGGDGFVLARLFREAGSEVYVYSFYDEGKYQGDVKGELIRLGIHPLPFKEYMDKRPKVDLIIDAIFGIGLSRHLSPEIVELLEILNENSQAKRVAIDIPTGISTNTGELLPIAFKADVTITFARKKPGQLLLPGKLYCGEIICDNIGISDKIIQEVEPYIIENNIALWSEYLPIPKMDAHKYQRGMVAVIGGGAESSGAARMAAIAAARAGAGVVKVYCPLEAREIYASTLLSVMVESFVDHRDLLQKIRDNIKISAIIVGPGLGKVGNSDLIIKLLESRIPIVLDADALTIFEGNSEVLFNNIHSSVIMTPHAGEFRKLFGEYSDKLSACFAAATQSGATIVSKGSDTIIANSEFAVINTNSKPTLATAGSGDVLTGIISGLLAFNQQKCETRQISLDHLKMGNIIKIACLAVTIHSECANKLGFGIIAEDLLDAIPQVITDSNSKQ